MDPYCYLYTTACLNWERHAALCFTCASTHSWSARLFSIRCIAIWQLVFRELLLMGIARVPMQGACQQRLRMLGVVGGNFSKNAKIWMGFFQFYHSILVLLLNIALHRGCTWVEKSGMYVSCTQLLLVHGLIKAA